MLEKFAERVGPDLEKLEQAISCGQQEEAVRAAHTLKGAAANLSAGSVRQAASDVERACRAGQFEEAGRLLVCLREAAGRCVGRGAGGQGAGRGEQ